jgi:hypothetical protein
MSYSFFEGEQPRLFINPDCPDARTKKLAVFAAECLTAGSSAPGDLDPHDFELVEKVCIPGTNHQEVIRTIGSLGLEELRVNSVDELYAMFPPEAQAS